MSNPVVFDIRCPMCGMAIAFWGRETLNAGRFPDVRRQVLDRTVMSVTCGGCEQRITVERETLYVDFDRGLFVLVFPWGERHRHEAHGQLGGAVFDRVVKQEAPAIVWEILGETAVRVVHGYEQLREKVVIADARLDDRVVEVVKARLLRDIAMLGENGVASMVLERIGEHGGPLAFVPIDADGRPLDLSPLVVDRLMYDDFAAGRTWLRDSGWFASPYVHHTILSEVP